MVALRGTETERSLREEIERIDRSVLLLIDARDRAVAALRVDRIRRGVAESEAELGEIAMARGWAAETGISDRVARRVAHWLQREGMRARTDPHISTPAVSTTCVLERPVVTEEPTVRLHRAASRTSPIR